MQSATKNRMNHPILFEANAYRTKKFHQPH